MAKTELMASQENKVNKVQQVKPVQMAVQDH
jgi:hypothetical protein